MCKYIMKLTGVNTNNNLTTYEGRNKYSIGLGKSRNTAGSINRVYGYCQRTSSTPLYCLFGFPTKIASAVWSNPFGSGLTGLNKSVNVLSFGLSGNLFVGGSFNDANGVNCNCLGIFNTKTNNWFNPFKNSLNENLFLGHGPVRAIVPTSTTVYVGGLTNDESQSSDGINGVAVWNPLNPTSFTPLGGGTSSSDCYCIAVTSEYVAVGNGFGWVYNTVPPDSQDETLATSIAIWNLNTSAWENIQPGQQGLGNEVYTFKQIQNGTYIGGRFQTLITDPTIFLNYVAFFSGSQISPLGEGIYYSDDNIVKSIEVDSSEVVYVGGKFQATGNNNTFGNTFNNIGKYNGVSWSSLGTGLNGLVNCIKIAPNGDLYVTGEFTATGDGLIQLNYIARWRGNTWSPVGGGLNAKGNYICFDNQGGLYVGGEFTMAGNVNCNCIAKFSVI